MSQAHVEIATRGTDAYNRRDVDAFADLTTPDYEWFRHWPLSRAAVTGDARALKTYFADMRNHWEEVRVFSDEISRGRTYLDHGAALRAAGLAE